MRIRFSKFLHNFNASTLVVTKVTRLMVSERGTGGKLRDFNPSLDNAGPEFETITTNRLSKKNYGDLWIPFDSRNSLQHPYKWFIVGDKISASILHKLKHISLHHDVHFQWILSYVELYGNEMADKPEKKDFSIPIPSSLALTYLGLFSLRKSQNLMDFRVPPTHH
ncbi:uncharacterized protein TNCV_1542031 [Trichonephila clavipes]|nr:uncharacterized protein TNCV_1542031 [Trichonephila clavipes]